MTEPVPDPTPTDPAPVDPAPAAICGAPNPSVAGITCQLEVGHFDHRRPHTAVVGGDTYEWE